MEVKTAASGSLGEKRFRATIRQNGLILTLNSELIHVIRALILLLT